MPGAPGKSIRVVTTKHQILMLVRLTSWNDTLLAKQTDPTDHSTALSTDLWMSALAIYSSVESQDRLRNSSAVWLPSAHGCAQVNTSIRTSPNHQLYSESDELVVEQSLLNTALQYVSLSASISSGGCNDSSDFRIHLSYPSNRSSSKRCYSNTEFSKLMGNCSCATSHCYKPLECNIQQDTYIQRPCLGFGMGASSLFNNGIVWAQIRACAWTEGSDAVFFGNSTKRLRPMIGRTVPRKVFRGLDRETSTSEDPFGFRYVQELSAGKPSGAQRTILHTRRRS